MKRIYKSQTVNAGGVTITVRQVFGFGSDKVPPRIAAAAITARQVLQLAIPQLVTVNASPLMRASFRFCFHADASPEKVNIVRSVLSTIQASLSRPFGVKVLDIGGGTLGYVSRYYSGCVQMTGNVLQYDSDGDLVHSRGEIHLDKNILNDGDTTTVTLIHEAGHKFANLRDFSWRGYFRSDFSNFEDNNLTWQEAMFNADSHAVLAYFLANEKLAKQRLVSLKRADRRAKAAAAGDEDLDLGSLFGN